MKNKFLKILFFLFLFIFTNTSTIFASGATGIEVNLEVGGCNNNGVCEVGQEDIFSCPADCRGHGGGGLLVGSTAYFYNNLTITPSYTSAIIKWNSNVPTMSTFKWGTTEDYKDGVLSNVNYLLNHQVELINLQQGTLYHFRIESESIYKGVSVLNNQIFKTLTYIDITPPANPTNVHAYSNINGITLTWVNPRDNDFDYIRIMRNESRYYSSPLVGKLVYEGSGKYFLDTDVVKKHKYYYTLFSRDKRGNYSSGALISIIHNPFKKNDWGEVLTPEPVEKTLPNVFIITENTLSYDFHKGDSFSLDGDYPINIKINYTEKGPDEDMWVEIHDTLGGIVGQYFFTSSADREGFINVTIPSFSKAGNYDIDIYKYNKDNEKEILNSGTFHIYKKSQRGIIWTVSQSISFILLVLFILIIILLIISKISSYLKRKKDNKTN